MFALCFVVVFFVACDLVALHRASVSDGIESTEWERRQHWYGFH
jgi:hypothetical protein